MNREVLINSLEEFMSETDARLTALEAAKPQDGSSASCDEMLDMLLLSNADKRAAIANLTAQCNTLAAQVDDLRNVNAGLRKHNASQQALIAAVRSRSLRRLEAIKKQWDVDAALRADNARLRSALKMVEWVKDDFGEYSECPWCHENEETNHNPSCARQAALR